MSAQDELPKRCHQVDRSESPQCVREHGHEGGHSLEAGDAMPGVPTIEGLEADLRAALIEVGMQVGERKQAEAQRDEARGALDKAVREMLAVRTERDKTRGQRDSERALAGAMEAQRDKAITDAVLMSREKGDAITERNALEADIGNTDQMAETLKRERDEAIQMADFHQSELDHKVANWNDEKARAEQAEAQRDEARTYGLRILAALKEGVDRWNVKDAEPPWEVEQWTPQPLRP